jgi:hypothetical protein
LPWRLRPATPAALCSAAASGAAPRPSCSVALRLSIASSAAGTKRTRSCSPTALPSPRPQGLSVFSQRKESHRSNGW